METDLKAWWFTMSPARLQNHLTNKLKYPPPIVAGIVEQVRKARDEKRAQSIKHTMAYKQWAKVLEPARAELTSLRTIKSQMKKSQDMDEAKWDALCQYEAVIATTVERIKKIQRQGEHTPAQFAAYLKREGKRSIPNNGEHWTDWVAYSKRQELSTLFLSLKPPARGRRIEPFKRKVSRTQFKADRAALFARLQTDLANAEQIGRAHV